VIIVDSGFILALLDQRDAWHGRAKAFASSAEEGWITTWPVITESAYLLLTALGPKFAAGLMDDVATGGLRVWEIAAPQVKQLPVLMRKYADLPMDLADASLVLLAEHLDSGRILSTDERDFRAYRWKQRKPFHNLLAA
jgi:uncharacterized protein